MATLAEIIGAQADESVKLLLEQGWDKGGEKYDIGTYHGEEGFRELSHAKPVFQRARFFPTELFYPPVNLGWRGAFQRMWMNFYVGKADASLGGTPYGRDGKQPLSMPRFSVVAQ